MPFERFEKTAYTRNVGRNPLISISKCRIVTFYCACCEEFIPKDSTHVNLYFDRENNKIGFEFITARDRKSFTKKLSSHSSSRSPFWIHCRPFLSYTEFKSPEKFYFKAQKENDLITIDLNNPVKLEDL